MAVAALLRKTKNYLRNHRLAKKYRRIAVKVKQDIENDGELPHFYSDSIFVCWLQGMDNAPDIVKICYNSLLKYHPDKEIIVITEDNYSQYVTLPQFIIDKYKNGNISRTHFSDLLRLELLIKYGGCWVDATAYFTAPIPDYVFDTDLFIFQDFQEHVGRTKHISSWFINSVSNNELLIAERALLYKYWEKNTRLNNYFLFHFLFVNCVIPEFLQEWKAVPISDNSSPKILDCYLFQPYDDGLYEVLSSKCFIHKFMYKYPQEKFEMEGTFYHKLKQSVY